MIATGRVPDQAAQDKLAASVAELPGRGYATVETGPPTGTPKEALILAAAVAARFFLIAEPLHKDSR